MINSALTPEVFIAMDVPVYLWHSENLPFVSVIYLPSFSLSGNFV